MCFTENRDNEAARSALKVLMHVKLQRHVHKIFAEVVSIYTMLWRPPPFLLPHLDSLDEDQSPSHHARIRFPLC